MSAKRGRPFRLDMSFEEALKRFAGVDPIELRKEWDRVQEKQGKISGKVSEAKDSIRKGARRAKTRFHI
jgi:hypothetical protein